MVNSIGMGVTTKLGPFASIEESHLAAVTGSEADELLMIPLAVAQMGYETAADLDPTGIVRSFGSVARGAAHQLRSIVDTLVGG
jgi:hypothetical protein